MWKRNDGKSEQDILQNRFTRYLMTAVKRRKVLYIRGRNARINREIPFEMQEGQSLLQVEPNMLEMLPLLQKLETSFAIRNKRDEGERTVYLSGESTI